MRSPVVRREEVCGLRWADVDLDERIIRVQETRIQVGRRIVEGTTKSGKPRTVHITPATADVLRSWRKRQAEERLAFGPEYAATGLVFTDEAGQGVRPDTLGQTFRRMVAESGVRRCRLHDLRHLSASLGAMSGETIGEFADRLGHSSTAITERLYLHYFDDSRRAAAEKRAAVL